MADGRENGSARVVAEGHGLRVTVAEGFRHPWPYYRLQVLGPACYADGPRWRSVEGSSSATLALLLRKFGASAPALADLCAGLPDAAQAALEGGDGRKGG